MPLHNQLYLLLSHSLTHALLRTHWYIHHAEAVTACTVVLRPAAKAASGSMMSSCRTSSSIGSGAGNFGRNSNDDVGGTAGCESCQPMSRWGRAYMVVAFALIVALVSADQNLLAPNVRAVVMLSEALLLLLLVGWFWEAG